MAYNSAKKDNHLIEMSFPPLAALLLTHFDDTQGQSVVFYASVDDHALPSDGIEHTTLPSGLHTLSSDYVLTTHHSLPTIALFRSRERPNGEGRGRLMGSLGVIPAPPSTTEQLSDLQQPLEDLYDRLEKSSDPFSPDARSPSAQLLRDVWEKSKAKEVKLKLDPLVGVRRVRALLSGQSLPSQNHPVAYLPLLLDIFGPSIVTIYRAVISGKRILLYSPPPLWPLGAISWCIWAMSLPPVDAVDASIPEWMGHIGLMDMDGIKAKTGGWVATTSDAIYRTHPAAYDLYIDLSSVDLPLDPSTGIPAPTLPPPILSSIDLTQPSGSRNSTAAPHPITYMFADLPLYRSLLLLSSSPSSVTVSTKLSKSGGLWLVVFELYERMWKLCVGVCEYAVGRGKVGDVRLEGEDGENGEEGEERLLDDPLYGEYDEAPDMLASGLDFAEAGPSIPPRSREAGGEGDEAGETQEAHEEGIRRGILILRQLHHNSYHLFRRLRRIRKGAAGGQLKESELRTLCKSGWWGSKDLRTTAEGGFWTDLANSWGVTIDED